MAIRTRANKVAHVLERTGLAMAGASGGLYVGAHALNAGLFASAALLLAMIVLGAVGFYLGIDLPPKEETIDAAGVTGPARMDWADWLSSIGTFLAAAVAFLAVFRIVEGADPRAMSAVAIAVVWLFGVVMQIVAGAIARHER
jgi:uncharacterized membrane protein